MSYKDYGRVLEFATKENISSIYQKKYLGCHDYFMEIDFKSLIFNFGNKGIQNFLPAESGTVAKCVRLKTPVKEIPSHKEVLSRKYLKQSKS